MRPTRTGPRPAAGELDLQQLERLSRIDAGGQPVLTIYLDLDPSRFPTPSARDDQLGALLDQARREASNADAERILALLNADPAITHGARSLAIFSASRVDVLEVVRLPSAVEPMVVVDTIPWLEPLAAMISPGDWGVAVVSRRAARLFRGGPHGLSEFASVHDELHRRHAQGGWSQARFQRAIEEQVAAHVDHVAQRVLRAHRRRPFAHLVIVAGDELRPMIEGSLHAELTAVLTATIAGDLEHASTDQVRTEIAGAIERSEADRERELLARIDEALGTGGPAAAGLDEVLVMLQEQRVRTLVVQERFDLRAGLCPTCGRLWTDGGRRCPLDGAALEEVDGVIEEAARQSVEVVVALHEPGRLAERGGVAALLRW